MHIIQWLVMVLLNMILRIILSTSSLVAFKLLMVPTSVFPEDYDEGRLGFREQSCLPNTEYTSYGRLRKGIIVSVLSLSEAWLRLNCWLVQFQLKPFYARNTRSKGVRYDRSVGNEGGIWSDSHS